MLLQSKFDVGDKVWYISNNRVNSGEISGVFIEVTEGEVNPYVDVFYELWNIGKMSQKDVFGTKKELLDTL